jgi:cytidine deaminase
MATTPTSEALTPLLLAAKTASEAAYAPYSQFNVGAAVQTTEGFVITGVNVENASYGLSHCAERTALHTAISQKYAGKLMALALWANDANQQYNQRFEGAATPCGACRQVMAELLPPDADVQFIHPQTGTVTHTTPKALLPHSFSL